MQKNRNMLQKLKHKDHQNKGRVKKSRALYWNHLLHKNYKLRLNFEKKNIKKEKIL